MTSLSPLIHTSAFLARTGSAPSDTWPVVVMTFGLAGNSVGMRGSSLAPAVTEKVTSALLASAVARPFEDRAQVFRVGESHGARCVGRLWRR